VLATSIIGLASAFSTSARADYNINDVSGVYVWHAEGWSGGQGNTDNHPVPLSAVGLVTYTPATGTFHSDLILRLDVAFHRTNIPRQGLLRPCRGFEPSFSSLSNALLHFLQGNESGLSSVDLPLPLVENLLMPIRHRHLIFVLRERSPNSLHRCQLFLYRHLIQRQHSIHKQIIRSHSASRNRFCSCPHFSKDPQGIHNTALYAIAPKCFCTREPLRRTDTNCTNSHEFRRTSKTVKVNW
jgi:hypothetical protein